MLPPAADANRHLIVVDLIAGADAMQGKGATKPAAGAGKVVQAANRYGQYFDHPSWQPLRCERTSRRLSGERCGREARLPERGARLTVRAASWTPAAGGAIPR
jgi:hypothetical protein